MDLGGVVAVAIVVSGVVVAPMAFIALFRYFDHRETMRRLERFDAGQLAQLDLAELRMRERWRIRSGILGGACTAALGIAGMVGAGWVYSVQARAAHLAGEAPPTDELTLIGLALFLVLVGLVITVGHLVWSRRSTLPEGDAPAAQPPASSNKA